MNYRQALDYLYSLSDFERGAAFTHSPAENLPREAYLLALLNDPQQDYDSTLIAGTKGKGSTAAFLERVLRESGMHTGLYTQPDLHTFRERIRVDGALISEDETAALLSEMRSVIERIQQQQLFSAFITYEVATALALLYFSRRRVQHAVVEVGLGGRLDATNVTSPLVSVISSISYDHMQILGNTLSAIASEKAGIIKPGGLVVTSAREVEALNAIATVARERGAQLVRVGAGAADPAEAEVAAGRLPSLTYRYHALRQKGASQLFSVWTPERTYQDLEIALSGAHQIENATLALATLDVLRVRHAVTWDEHSLREGLRSTYWPARLEVIASEPTLVVDGAHNTDSIQKMLQALRTTFSFQRLIVVLSVARDKDLRGIVKELGGIDAVVITRSHNTRAAAILELAELFAQEAPRVNVATAASSAEAMQLALAIAGRGDLVCATGSLYLAAEVLRWSAVQGNAAVASSIEGVDHP